MKPPLPSFLAVSVLAAVPAGAVHLTFHDASISPFVFGAAAVAGVTSLALTVARRTRWYVHLVCFVGTVLVLPIVAGGVTGALAGLVEQGPGGIWSGMDTGLMGSAFLYGPLLLASVFAWGVGWAAEAANARWSARNAPAWSRAG